jgi:hypothetical protein
MRRRPRVHPALVAISVLGVAALSVSTIAAASHDFSDVPNNNPFHDEISAIADAGITTGFVDGTYRPGADVSRGSMAAFLGRGLPRVGYDEGSSSAATSAFQTLAEVDMERGAEVASGEAGFYVVTGTIEANTTGTASCPCTLNAFISGPDSTIEGVTGVLALPNDNSGRARESLTVQAVVPAGPDLPEPEFTLSASAFRNSGSGEPTYVMEGSLSVLYVPFGFDGTQALAPPTTDPA